MATNVNRLMLSSDYNYCQGQAVESVAHTCDQYSNAVVAMAACPHCLPTTDSGRRWHCASSPGVAYLRGRQCATWQQCIY